MKRAFRTTTEYAGAFRGSLRKKLSSKRGMTLTEMLASLLIMSMVTLVIAGGVMAVKRVYEKTVDQADAQMVLATTVELITDELANAAQEETKTTGSGTSQTSEPVFLSGKGSGWITLDLDPDRGICKVPENEDVKEKGVPLLSSSAMAGKYVTRFAKISYQKEKACFTVENIAVYEKASAGNGGSPVASLPVLTVRAVNLEGR